MRCEDSIIFIMGTCALVLVTLVVGCTLGAPTERAAPESTAPEKPNILFILTDDADRTLLWRMPDIRRKMVQRGTTFKNTLSPFPLCCPNRATILTGLYPHNHGVLANEGEAGGAQAFRDGGYEEDNVATRLQAAGYRSGYFGKYLNEWGGDYEPPGWHQWHAWKGRYGAKNTMYENGELNAYDLQKKHEADIVGAKAASWISHKAEGDEPFFAFVAFRSPHGPTLVEKRYKRWHPERGFGTKPSFDEADVSDKPAWIKRLPRLSDGDEREMREMRIERARAMRSVDEEVADLIAALRDAGELESTYIFLYNDNGFHMGEHRIPEGKRTPYEEDVRYPLLVRGPHVPKGEVREELVSSTDIAPTFLDLSGGNQEGMDGRSLAPLLGGEPVTEWRDALLLEGWHLGDDTKTYDPPDFQALRTEQYSYVRYATGETEVYDLFADPFQLESISGSRPEVEANLSARLDELSGCSGESCRLAENPH